jgi:hypothetical protein
MTFHTAQNDVVAERWRIASDGNFGNVKIKPTAQIHIAAGTTAASTAPLKFTDGSFLSTLEPGAMEMAEYTLWFTPADTTLRHSLDGTIFAQTQTVSVTGTASETTLTGTGRGVKTLPSNWFSLIGRSLRVTARGYYSAQANQTLVLRVKIVDDAAATCTCASAAMDVASASSRMWAVSAIFTCYGLGGTGKLWGQGIAQCWTSSAIVSVCSEMVNTAESVVDITDTLDVDVTADWLNNDASSITCTNLLIETLD